MGAFCYAYLHGFASSPAARKGVALAADFEAWGQELHRPDLNRPRFNEMSYAQALEALDEMDARIGGGRTWRLIGSSMGGYLAARWAELRPSRVDRLLLLCPGFDMWERWKVLVGQGRMARWQSDGWLEFPGPVGEMEPLHWEFMRQMQDHPSKPEVRCATRIIHGVRDEVVPIAHSRLYCAQFPEVKLVEVDDDHGLLASTALISRHAREFFDIG